MTYCYGSYYELHKDIPDVNFKNPQTHARAERSWISRHGLPKWYKPCSHYPDDSVEFLKTWNIEGAVHLNKGKISKIAFFAIFSFKWDFKISDLFTSLLSFPPNIESIWTIRFTFQTVILPRKQPILNLSNCQINFTR